MLPDEFVQQEKKGSNEAAKRSFKGPYTKVSRVLQTQANMQSPSGTLQILRFDRMKEMPVPRR
jgi:hypothetical protein